MLKLDEIYHPILAKVYKVILLVSFILTTTCLIPAIFIILTQSKQAKIFKYLLINQLLWSYFFCFIFVATGFVPLYPIPAFYSSNLFMPIGPENMHIILPLYLLSSIGHMQSFFIICLYRMTYASAFHRFQAWFEDPKKLVIIIVGFLLFLSAVLIGPFLFEKYDAVQLHQDLLIAYPELEELPHKTSIVMAPFVKLSNNTYKMTLFSYNIYIYVMYLSVLIIYLSVLRQAFRRKDIMSTQTYKNYCILVRAQTIQIISLTIFLFIPYLIQFFLYFSQVKNGSIIAIIAHFSPNYQLFAEILALFYFVKPYREYLGKIFKRMGCFRSHTQKRVKKGFNEFQLGPISNTAEP